MAEVTASADIKADPDSIWALMAEIASRSTTMKLEVELPPAGDGTRTRMTLDLEPRWHIVPVSAIMWPLLMRKRAQASMGETVVNIKRLIETPG